MCSGLKRLSDLGEFGLLGELERRGLIAGLDAEGALFEGGFVATQDLLTEDKHFLLAWTSWRDLGYKSAAVNLSDLAAMGAEPLGLLVGLALPDRVAEQEALELYEGLNEPGIAILGGDTVAAEQVTLSIAAIGRSERVPGRAGARPGDLLVVTGPLGGAAAGLQALQDGLEGFGELVERHHRPPIRLEEGRALARVAHAMVDISDGILSDAAHIAERSHCKLVIDVESLPLAARIEEVEDGAIDLPFWTMGEDYELLAALAPADAEASGFPIVGRVEEGSGVEPESPTGWDAFRGR
jgi:thiamine-monophosphate kinase